MATIMAHLMTILARRGGDNDAANQWLDKHPMVLGGGFFALGAVIIVFGVLGLKSGTTTDKRGNKLSGGSAMAMGIVRLVAGVFCCGFGIYKMLAG